MSRNGIPGACRSPRNPEDVVKAPRSFTGRYLAPLLEKRRETEAAE